MPRFRMAACQRGSALHDADEDVVLAVEHDRLHALHLAPGRDLRAGEVDDRFKRPVVATVEDDHQRFTRDRGSGGVGKDRLFRRFLEYDGRELAPRRKLRGARQHLDRRLDSRRGEWIQGMLLRARGDDRRETHE